MTPTTVSESGWLNGRRFSCILPKPVVTIPASFFSITPQRKSFIKAWWWPRRRADSSPVHWVVAAVVIGVEGLGSYWRGWWCYWGMRPLSQGSSIHGTLPSLARPLSVTCSYPRHPPPHNRHHHCWNIASFLVRAVDFLRDRKMKENNYNMSAFPLIRVHDLYIICCVISGLFPGGAHPAPKIDLQTCATVASFSIRIGRAPSG